jgi:hypothetical protein
MMSQGMMHGRAMMWGMGLIGLLAVAALVLFVGVLAKYGSGANLIGGHRGSGSTPFITLPTLPPRQRTCFYL